MMAIIMIVFTGTTTYFRLVLVTVLQLRQLQAPMRSYKNVPRCSLDQSLSLWLSASGFRDANFLRGP